MEGVVGLVVEADAELGGQFVVFAEGDVESPFLAALVDGGFCLGGVVDG